MMTVPAADLHPHVVTVVAFQTLSFLSAVFSVRYTQNITSYMKCGQNKKDLFSSFVIDASFLCTNCILLLQYSIYLASCLAVDTGYCIRQLTLWNTVVCTPLAILVSALSSKLNICLSGGSRSASSVMFQG